MKHAVFADLHNDIEPVKRFLIRHADTFDQRYFLGDFFDEYNDGPLEATITANFVKELLSDPRNNLCMGNHDMPYRYPSNPYVGCPGFEVVKSRVINQILDANDWSKIKLAYVVDGWLLSHAGIHPSFWGYPRIPSVELTDILQMCDTAIQRVDDTRWDRLVMRGADRGGRFQELGGITWLDWGKFLAFPGINQIVGHTPMKTPIVKIIDKAGNHHDFKQYNWLARNDPLKDLQSINWCIDSQAHDQFAVIEDGNVTVHKLDAY